MTQLSLLDQFQVIELGTALAATLAALLGLYIGYQAYRGLRRNDSPAMRCLAIGMILLFGVTYVTALVGQSLISMRILPIRTQDVIRLVVRVLQVSGLAIIAYSLRLARQERTSGHESATRPEGAVGQD